MPAVSLYDYLLKHHPSTLRMILDDVGKIAVLVVDENLRVVTYNKQFEALTGKGILKKTENSLRDIMKPVDNSSSLFLPPKGSCWKVNVAFVSGVESGEDEENAYEVYIFSDKNEYVVCCDDLVNTDVPASARMARLNEELTDLMRELQKKNRELEKAKSTIHHMAMHDVLTELYNRRACQLEIEKIIAASARHGFPVVAVMFDIDHFKNVNDTFGHEAGDEVIKEFGRILRESCRKEDVAGRWGGEEFVMLMPYTNAEEGRQVCERARRLVQAAAFSNVTGTVTVSAGLSELRNKESLDSLMARVDEALYEAKSSGRNRVIVRG